MTWEASVTYTNVCDPRRLPSSYCLPGASRDPSSDPQGNPAFKPLVSVLYCAKHGEESSRVLVLGVPQFTQLHMCK